MSLAVVKVKAVFFDKKAVKDAVGKDTADKLRKAGAYARTTMRRMIRKRKKASKPGQGPTDRGGALKRLIFFSYDTQQRSVVVGPTIFSGKTPVPGGADTVPQALEEGGSLKFEQLQLSNREWVDEDSRRGKASKKQKRGTHNRRFVQARLKPRPFKQPAFEATVKKLPGIWAK